MTFGPLPERAPGRRLRGRVVPGARDFLALAALLLDYPDDALVAKRAELVAAVRALGGAAPRTPESSGGTHGHSGVGQPAAPGPRTSQSAASGSMFAARGPGGALGAFADWFADADPDELRVEYVRTFDHKRRNALYVTFAAHGDMRRRGEALLAFKSLYRANGFEPRPDELPDYLPMVLQFAAQAPTEAANAALALARPGIELVAKSLADAASPWAPVLGAVRACLPPLDAASRRVLAAVAADGPPEELVGVASVRPEGVGA